MLKLKKKVIIGWEEIEEEYQIVEIIGEGGYGVVCKAIHRSTNTTVAIKKQKYLFDDPVNAKRVLREVCLLRQLRHPNIVQLYTILLPKDLNTFDSLYLVFEYAPSDILRIMYSNLHFKISHIQIITYQILLALKYLHNSNVIHRDLKPGNILIYKDKTAKICDFGMARTTLGILDDSFECKSVDEISSVEEKENEIQENKRFFTEACEKLNVLFENKDNSNYNNKSTPPRKRRTLSRGALTTRHIVTRWYRAPELILREKYYGPAIDMWSVGCIFAELLTMLHGHSDTPAERNPLFPGVLTPVISPQRANHKYSHVFATKFTGLKVDQLEIILDIIGTPNDQEIHFISHSPSRAYLKSLPPRMGKSLQELFPKATSQSLDFLKKLLIFNPYTRLTLEEAFEHPFFEDVRKEDLEISGDTQIDLIFEDEGIIDNRRIRELFIEEVLHYQQLREMDKPLFN